MNPYTTHVRLVDGRAEVRNGGRYGLNVARRDLTDEPYVCPVELVMAALGS